MVDETKPMTRPIKAIRKDTYATFEKIVGRAMTDAEHASIKTLVTEYVEIYRKELGELKVSVEKHNKAHHPKPNKI